MPDPYSRTTGEHCERPIEQKAAQPPPRFCDTLSGRAASLGIAFSLFEARAGSRRRTGASSPATPSSPVPAWRPPTILSNGMAAARWAGLAAILGGLCWIVKGALIMLTGEQPPYIFEIAPVFFALGAVGLYVQRKAAADALR